MRVSRGAMTGIALLAAACACPIEEGEPRGEPRHVRPMSTGSVGSRPVDARRAVPPRAANPLDGKAASSAIDARLPPAPPALSAGPGSKAAIHIATSDPERIALAFAKAREIIDHRKAQGRHAAVELLIEPGAAKAIIEPASGYASTLATLMRTEAALAVSVCDGEGGRGAPPANPRTRHVASCGARLIELRQAGYAYIRP